MTACHHHCVLDKAVSGTPAVIGVALEEVAVPDIAVSHGAFGLYLHARPDLFRRSAFC